MLLPPDRSLLLFTLHIAAGLICLCVLAVASVVWVIPRGEPARWGVSYDEEEAAKTVERLKDPTFYLEDSHRLASNSQQSQWLDDDLETMNSICVQARREAAHITLSDIGEDGPWRDL